MEFKQLYIETWGNGATIEVLYHVNPIVNEDLSDRIHLIITQSNGEPRGWLMNQQDAIGIIRGLSVAIAKCIEDNIPPALVWQESDTKNIQGENLKALTSYYKVRDNPDYSEKLDPEIIPLCDALNTVGFATIASCSGVGHHSSSWPSVWFEHSDDERIENMARFVMLQTKELFERFFVQFSKVLDDVDGDGYHWYLVVHLTKVFGDSPIEVSREETVYAVAQVSQAIAEWARMEEKIKDDIRIYN